MTGYVKSTVIQSEFTLHSFNSRKALEIINRQIGTGSGFWVVPGPNVSLIMELDSLSAKFACQAERISFFWCTKDFDWGGFRTRAMVTVETNDPGQINRHLPFHWLFLQRLPVTSRRLSADDVIYDFNSLVDHWCKANFSLHHFCHESSTDDFLCWQLLEQLLVMWIRTDNVILNFIEETAVWTNCLALASIVIITKNKIHVRWLLNSLLCKFTVFMARSLFRVCSLFFCGFAEGQGTLHNRKVKKTCFFFVFLQNCARAFRIKSKKDEASLSAARFSFFSRAHKCFMRALLLSKNPRSKSLSTRLLSTCNHTQVTGDSLCANICVSKRTL